MKKFKSSLVSLVSLLIAGSCWSQSLSLPSQPSLAPALQAGVLVEGQYSAAKPFSEIDGNWLALQKTQAGWSLVPSPVKTLMVASQDDNVRVDVSSPLPRVQALLRSPKLKQGSVSTMKLADGSLQPTFSKGTAGYAPVLVSHRPEHQEFKVTTLASEGPLIVFVTGSGDTQKTTVIGKAPSSIDSDFASVFWMGDLDRDGKTDLITSQNSQPTVFKLWLSSEARGSESLGLAN